MAKIPKPEETLDLTDESLPPSRQQGPAEAEQLVPRYMRTMSIAHSPIRRSKLLMGLRDQLRRCDRVSAPVLPPERLTGTPELQHSEGGYHHN